MVLLLISGSIGDICVSVVKWLVNWFLGLNIMEGWKMVVVGIVVWIVVLLVVLVLV